MDNMNMENMDSGGWHTFSVALLHGTPALYYY